eukprot:scaffold4498_cov119-Isochrysis_galbana.AAC.29
MSAPGASRSSIVELKHACAARPQPASTAAPPATILKRRIEFRLENERRRVGGDDADERPVARVVLLAVRSGEPFRKRRVIRRRPLDHDGHLAGRGAAGQTHAQRGHVGAVLEGQPARGVCARVV